MSSYNCARQWSPQTPQFALVSFAPPGSVLLMAHFKFLCDVFLFSLAWGLGI